MTLGDHTQAERAEWFDRSQDAYDAAAYAEEDAAADSESPYCDCTDEHTLNEIEENCCDCCGKEIDP